jgi:hypothetical protein
MDSRVAHPVVLAVHHVVADLHVGEDLRQRERDGAADERGAPFWTQEQCPACELQAALRRDHAADVAGVLLAEVGPDRVADRIEFGGDRGEPLGLVVAGVRTRRRRAGGQLSNAHRLLLRISARDAGARARRNPAGGGGAPMRRR